MGTYASRRAAAQMEHDGIKTLPRWSKGRNVGFATIQTPMQMPKCDACHKRARYSTPSGFRCFVHTMKERPQ